MNIASMFGFKFFGDPKTTELRECFPMEILQGTFIKTDVATIYTRILVDVLERTQGISADNQALLWDNCLASESAKGLVTFIAEAMAEKASLFLVYDQAVKVIRKATSTEQATIKDDYAKAGESSVGVYINFSKYDRTDMVKFYSGLEYSTVASLYKQMNVSKAIQFKMNDLRASVGLAAASPATSQAVAMSTALGQGRNLLMDGKDMIEMAKPDLTSTNSAMDFIAQKRSFYLGLPASYWTGIASKGIGDTGQGDARKVSEGLKSYFYSIVKPCVEAIFGNVVTFEDSDYDNIASANETLKTFELTSEVYISAENKRLILNRQFGLPEDSEGDAPVKPVTPMVVPALPAPAVPPKAPA